MNFSASQERERNSLAAQSIQLNTRVEVEADGQRNFHAQYVIILMSLCNELMRATAALQGLHGA